MGESGDGWERPKEKPPDNELSEWMEAGGECERSDARDDGRDESNWAPKIFSRRRISDTNSLASASARAL